VAWAPEGSVCRDNCVALYEVEGVETPFNPEYRRKEIAIRDTCGWQNTYRLLEFVYEGQQTTLSEETSPAFLYVFQQKNGVDDLSTKPSMTGSSWYVPAYGQLRYLYGSMGFVNAGLAACGGTRFTTGSWYSSTEVGTTCIEAAWNLHHYGYSSYLNGWYKQFKHRVRAVRNF